MLRTGRIAVVLSALLAALSSVVVSAPSARAGTLDSGQTLPAGTSRWSPSGTYRLTMQTDGNLVEYGPSGATWASNTGGSGNRTTVGTDGNLVVYSAGGAALWQSGTFGNGGAVLQLQNDGNLVLYRANVAIWARTTSRTAAVANQLTPGQWINSGSGRFRFFMQTDGNLVLYDGNAALWATNTSGSGNFARLGTDGNFVVYNSGGTPLWQSGTAGATGAPTLDVQNDGNVVLYSVGGAYWAKSSSRTVSPVSNTVWTGQALDSPNGQYHLRMQTDGNLVLYGGGGAEWWTATSGSGNRLVVQADGNLVVYSGSTALWHTFTGGHPGSSTLDVQNDGNVVLYQVGGAIWDRKGYVQSASPAARAAVTWASNRLGWTNWDPDRCLTFVYDAYLQGAGIDITAGLPQAQARGTAYSYWTVAPSKHSDRNPPAGALVFWRSPTALAPGHVGISQGGGVIISSYDGRTSAVHRFDINSYQQNLYLGWVRNW